MGWFVTLFLLVGLVFVVGGGAALTQAQGPESQQAVGIQSPLGTSFTYQGELKQSCTAVNGTADFRFDLWDAASGGNQVATWTVPGVSVSEGILTVQLDFGDVFNGDARWLGEQGRRREQRHHPCPIRNCVGWPLQRGQRRLLCCWRRLQQFGQQLCRRRWRGLPQQSCRR